MTLLSSINFVNFEEYYFIRKYIRFVYKFLQSFFHKIFGLHVDMLSKH